MAKEKQMRLTQDQVFEVRMFMMRNKVSQTDLSKILGKSRVNINNVLTCKKREDGYKLGSIPELIWNWYQENKEEKGVK